MQGYYKLNADGTIQSANTQLDESWLSLDGLTKDTDGNFYEFYNADGTPDTVKNAASYKEYLVNLGLTAVEEHIQEQVDRYNLDNEVAFTNAHNCADYKDMAGYTHQQFCIDIWAFNVEVFEAARGMQDTVLSGIPPIPTEAEFKALLPVYIGL